MPTNEPSLAPTKDRMGWFYEILLANEVSGAAALQDGSSPQFLALYWLAYDDPMELDLDSTATVVVVERYVLTVLYFATGGEEWMIHTNVLSMSPVCDWHGVSCDGDGLVVELRLGESKPEEVKVLVSKCPC
jgi:hypothetical protein